MPKVKFILFLLLIISFKPSTAENFYIVYKVNNEIITNSDIEKEYRYLVSLNNQLKNFWSGMENSFGRARQEVG